ncbi:hypothetical protein IC232_04110 [Microvirga sp. BT688]|uniref:hypothetical protein n=1 Tax=Microvirga sp. TaxID=1873136 RepID=UPI001683E3A8|nr:hypothetical protein [Microvirga sp.]MBD2745877.1 hypothetical protein [Microvirga sp.]
MTDVATAETPNLPVDPMTDVGHLLIRAYNGDQFDPFFVSGHPSRTLEPDVIIRSCFYYSILMTPKITMIYDNCGRGGMCDMTPDEISVIWKTPALLDQLGTTFEALQAGTAVITATEAPKPDIDLWARLAEAEGKVLKVA